MDFDVENEDPLFFTENGKRRSKDDVEFIKLTKRQRTTPLLDAENTLIIDDTNENLDLENGSSSVPIIVPYRRVLRHIPQDIPYVPVTTESGSRVYLRILETKKKRTTAEELGEYEDDDDEPRKLITTEGGKNCKLFNNWDDIKKEARLLKDKFHRSLANIVDNENVISGLGVNNQCEESLWVEKYKPRSYLDLLSEEGTNKTLLHWLKLWDKSVFGIDFLTKVKMTKDKYANLEAKEKEKLERDRKFHAKGAPAYAGLDEYDEMGRPKLKVALLFGPPGLGKTTCAHVIAKHAGYSVREMNASDDRSVDYITKVLDDALQSKSEIFQDGKPNCLIIDEIDGAPVATVNVLIELISGNAVEKGKKKLKKVLKRPIICICNDLYAPSLKELRKHALVLQFFPVTVSCLGERLHEISLREHLHLDSGTIQSLCEKSECDIRSCLSTLQFLKKKNCTPKDALFSQIGMKDKSKGLFSVWSDIFMIPDSKRNRYDNVDPSKPPVRFNSVLRVVQSYGEYEHLLGGVFENYLRGKFKDCYFESIIEGLSWNNWFCEMNASIQHHQNYSLMGYLPIHFVACHFLFGQRTWFKINFPSNEVAQKIPRTRNIISNMLSEVVPSVGRFLDGHDAIVDLFPCLLSVIQPSTIRPVPTQIWSARERETLHNIVEVMIAYNLSYSQMKSVESGAYNFVLEPDIEALTKLKLQDTQGSKRTFAYAVKQLVAREIETEKMRRNDNVLLDSQSQQPLSSQNEGNNSVKQQTQEFKVPKRVPVSSKIKMDSPAIMSKDFFGRMVAPSAQKTLDLLAYRRRTSGIYFRFKEGYSNAVRRLVKMKDLE